MLKPDGLLPIFIAWELNKGIEYTIEGGVFSVGSTIDWLFKNHFLKDKFKSGGSMGASAHLRPENRLFKR